MSITDILFHDVVNVSSNRSKVNVLNSYIHEE